ncbi:MAG: hypothetical protein WA941_00035 [Nitrososphaeraceae archaeon]
MVVDQSTISRDLQFIKQEAKKKIEKYLNEDILFEYLRYIAGSNEATRHLWELVQNEENAKDKMNVLSLLMQCYNKRLEMLIGGPESYMNAKKSVSEIKFQEKVDSNPVLKMLSERNRIQSPLSKINPFGKKIFLNCKLSMSSLIGAEELLSILFSSLGSSPSSLSSRASQKLPSSMSDLINSTSASCMYSDIDF